MQCHLQAIPGAGAVSVLRREGSGMPARATDWLIEFREQVGAVPLLRVVEQQLPQGWAVHTAHEVLGTGFSLRLELGDADEDGRILLAESSAFHVSL